MIPFLILTHLVGILLMTLSCSEQLVQENQRLRKQIAQDGSAEMNWFDEKLELQNAYVVATVAYSFLSSLLSLLFVVLLARLSFFALCVDGLAWLASQFIFFIPFRLFSLFRFLSL